MMRFHTILHPTDFSPCSANAFRYACALARDCDAKLICLHVVEPAVAIVGEGALVPDDLEELRSEARKQLDELRPSDPKVRLERLLREGPAPKVVLDAVDEFGADLIVMGTHGRTGLKRLLMGSVAEIVLRKAPCPVLTVKGPTQAPLEEGQLQTAGASGVS
jgi:nucleotide-binding universal stress UspA family protein